MPLIGNTNELAFEVTPVTPSWERRYLPEVAGWAGTAVWVGGQNLCRHIEPGSSEVSDHLYVPLAPIADWLLQVFPAFEFEERAALFPTSRHLHASAASWGNTAPLSGMSEDDWIDAREDWWLRHFLRAGTDGARLPDLAFARDDENLIVEWRIPRFVGDNAPTMLCGEGEFEIQWDQAHSTIRSLIAQVASWLRGTAVDGVYPWVREEDPLDRLPAELRTALEYYTGRRLDALEALFGVEQLGELLDVLHLNDACTDPAASPQCQILRDLSPVVGSEIGQLIAEVGHRVNGAAPNAFMRWRRARGLAIDAARAAESVEAAGQLAAIELRGHAGLDGQPVEDHAALLAEFGLLYEHSSVEGHHDRMIVGTREEGTPIAVTLSTPRTSRSWGQRFEAVRALGHLLLDPLREGAIGAASGPFAQETRRRRSGAFAAELLLPEAALGEASHGQLDGAAETGQFEALLERYGVGASVAAYQLWNRGWLSSPEVRDELIYQFAAV
ncbi:MAG: ImmA/IrrE family metallo-endopeptidase [Gaiellaceae bacterium]